MSFARLAAVALAATIATAAVAAPRPATEGTDVGIADVALSQGDVMRRLHELDQQIQQLQTARRLQHTTYKAPAALRFIDDQDRTRLKLGQTSESGADVNLRYESGDAPGVADAYLGALVSDQSAGAVAGHGFLVRQPDGTQVFVARNGGAGAVTVVNYPNGEEALAVFEGTAGEQTIGRDPTGAAQLWMNDQGLGLPIRPFMMAEGWDGADVAGSSFQEVAEGAVHRTYPTTRVDYRVRVTGTGSFEVRLVDFGTGSTIAGPNAHSSSAYSSLTGDLPGDHLSLRFLTLEARRTSGTGSAEVVAIAAAVGSV